MTWFAGSRHNEETREIKRLLKITKATASVVMKAEREEKKKKKSAKNSVSTATEKMDSSQNKTTQSVLLFCRLPKVVFLFLFSYFCHGHTRFNNDPATHRSHMYFAGDAPMSNMTQTPTRFA